jgi:TRAP-type C4-dicarboxylate transport system permease large subunit
LVAAYAVAVKRGYPAGTFPGWAVVGHSFAQSLPGLLVVVIIIVGILSGAFTATESASVAVIWALFLATMVYKKLTREQFLKAAAKAVKSTGAVLLLIGISSMFGYLIGLYGVAELTGQMLSSISATPWVIFLCVNIILFVLGTFLDMAATILICTPIFLPICQQMGLNTPPVGTTQFVGCTIGEVSVGTVMKTIWPFYGGLIAALMLVTYVPAFSMWLPNLILK